MKAIDKEDLVEFINTLKDQQRIYLDYTVGVREACTKILQKIESMPVKEWWTSVSEKLPEDGVYLVYAPDYKGGSSTAKEWNDGVMFSKCRKGKWSIEHGYYTRPNCVKAWMPIPTFKKEDEE